MLRLAKALGVMMLLNGTAAFAESYKVVLLRPPVYFRERLATKWTPVQPGQEIPSGVLFQVAVGGKVRLASSALAAATGVAAGGGELSVNEPMIFRLEPTAFRKIALSQEVLNEIPADAKDDPKALKAGSLLAEMTDALRREAVMVFRSKKDAQAPQGPVDEAAVGVAAKAKEIRILSPSNDAVLQAPSVPTKLLVIWEPPPGKANREFDVYVWPQGMPRPDASVRAHGTSAEVTVHKPGMHFIQVISDDGSFQSRPMVADIALPLSRNELSASAKDAAKNQAGSINEQDKFKNGKGGKPRGRFVALRPVNRTRLLMGVTTPTPIAFSWRFDQGEPTAEFLVVVRKLGAKGELVEFGRVATKIWRAVLALGPGEYDWSVTARFPATRRRPPETILKSKPRRFVISERMAGDLALEVRKMLRVKAPGHLFIENAR